MENFIGFIIFLVIIGVSIVNKIRTETKENQEGPEPRGRPLSLDEIPEATRRMLYGDGDGGVQVAKAKTAAPAQHQSPVQAHPVAARRVEVEQQRSQRSVPAPVRQQSRPVPSSRQVPAAVRTKPTMQMFRTETSQTRQQPRPRSRPASIIRPVRAAHKTAAKPPKVHSSRRKTLRQPPKAQPVPAAAPSAEVSLVAMLSSKNDLARGILLREILGPPKALEDII